MASVEEVERTLLALAGRLEALDADDRALLPARRTLEATCPDLDEVWHARWSDGTVGALRRGRLGRRPDIRIVVDSDDLLALASGELPFRRAWVQDRLRLDASVTDLLRLRAVL